MDKVTFEFVAPAELRASLRGGTEVVFAPLRVREIPAFAGAVKPLTALAGPLLQLAAEDGSEAQLAAVLLNAAADHGEALVQAVAIAARMPPEQVGELLPDELVVLAALAIRVNADFFTRALPAMRQAGEQLHAMTAAPAPKGSKRSTGQTPSTA